MGLEGVMDQSEARGAHLAPDILQPPHLAHGHHGRQAGHRVDGELGECSHLKIEKLIQAFILTSLFSLTFAARHRKLTSVSLKLANIAIN